MKVLAVGDIHTKTGIIADVWEVVDYYNAIIFVGDYADDWNASPSQTIFTWKLLKEFQEAHPSKVNIVMGNHDYIYVRETPSSQGGYNLETQTMLDLPENKDLKNWLSSLPIILNIDGVVYSHAGITEDWSSKYVNENERYSPNNMWLDDSPIWARPGHSEYRDDMPQVFGHTPSETCWEVEPSIWCIDTFSTYPNGTPVGDGTVLEITDGKIFEVKKLREIDEPS